jgi:hypothetical protein
VGIHSASLLLPTDAFPGLASPLRDEIAAAWKKSAGSEPAATLPAAANLPSLVVLVSAESPGRLAARVKALSRDPAMKGRLLGVWSLAGPVREDFPALILDGGNLAGLGVGSSGPVGLPGVPAEVGRLGAALAAPGGTDRRVEDLPAPLLWFF